MTFQSNHGLYDAGTFPPVLCTITDVTIGLTTLVTTAIDHEYVVGNELQFTIPTIWGILELNGLKGIVLETTSDTFVVNINSSQFSEFETPTLPPEKIFQYPIVLSIGDQNCGQNVITQAFSGTMIVPAIDLQIPGTYYNIPP